MEKTVGFHEGHSAAIRIWHWAFFLGVAATLITVLLASTVFRTRNNISMVQEQLQQKGMTVSQDQARSVAHEYNDKLWGLHTYIGYFLCGLLLVRILIEIAQPGEEKLRNRLMRALHLSPGTLKERLERQHYIRVKVMYIVFYCLILTMALTGIGLAFEDFPLFKTWHQGITQVHSFVQYLIYGFILLHLGGVIMADLGEHKGLVSGMIHGKRRI